MTGAELGVRENSNRSGEEVMGGWGGVEHMRTCRPS